jgi:FeS assembly protein SufB
MRIFMERNSKTTDFREPEIASFKTAKGLSRAVVETISQRKNEPAWMLEKRLHAYNLFVEKPMPEWGADLSGIDFENIHYYWQPSETKTSSWDDVPAEVRRTYDRLGIPQAEQKMLAGVGAQYESEVIYHNLQQRLADQGVIFSDVETAMREHPELVKEFFGTVVPVGDNKFASLNTAVWSGGSFIYVPKGVKIDLPLQAYFRINAEYMGQFERTLIIADEGSNVHYVEGCSAPRYATGSLHSAVVEIIVKKNARVRYTTIQNWSTNVYNLVTKRAKVYGNAAMEWVDGNLGCLTGNSKIMMERGVKEIKNVKSGDTVIALNGALKLVSKKITAKKQSGVQKVYTLTTANYRSIQATENHPFLAMIRRNRTAVLKWTELKDLRKGDLVATSALIPDEGVSYALPPTPSAHRIKRPIKTPAWTSPDLLWLIGFYFGDGYYDIGRIYFAVPKNDPAHDRVIELVQSLFGVERYDVRGVVIRFAAKQLIRWFVSIGVHGSARTKRIPEWIYALPHSEKRAFIEGYIAADGHKRDNHKNVSITSCNKQLLEDTKLLAQTCGMNPLKISKRTRREKKPLGKEVKEYTHYFLYFGDHECEESTQFVRITNKELVGEEMTYDIEVEDAHNFIANGFLVHNSRITMKYPSCVLMEPRAHGEVLSLAFAGKGQHQDAGAKMIHLAPHTTSRVVSKSVSRDGGRTSYRGLLKVTPLAENVKSNVRCDALILDPASQSDTYPTMDIQHDDVQIEHEAVVSKVGEEQLFYLQSRGVDPVAAEAMIVNGFLEPIIKELPMEYAVELNRMIQLSMEDSVG